jgi:hypothetical protein
MVHQISWTEFLLVACYVTAATYLLLAVIYFRHTLLQWGRSCLHRFTRKKHASDLQPDTVEAGLLGEVAHAGKTITQENTFQRTALVDLVPAPLTAPEDEPALLVVADVNQLSQYKQLLQDINTLRDAAIDFSKEECLSMLQIIFQNHIDVRAPSFKNQITGHVLEVFSDLSSFSLSHEEIDSLWSQ